MIIGFIGLAANIPLNWIFVFGKFGAPALGGVGCGVATALVYWLMFFAMLAYVLITPKLKRMEAFKTFYAPEPAAMWRIFKLGFPVAAAFVFEVTLFAAIALLISPLGPVTVAAHQIAINFSSMIFMLPMSIGTAVSIRVGHQLGEKSVEGAKRSVKVGLMIGQCTALATAGLTILFRYDIISLYSGNPEVVELAAHLMIMAAIYQCSDAVQVIAAGSLRGYKDMRAIFSRTFIAYWVVGMPLGYILGMTNWLVPAMGATGFWIGIIIGLSTAALLLGIRLKWISSQTPEFQLAMSEK